jgi:glycerate dehydrogenase
MGWDEERRSARAGGRIRTRRSRGARAQAVGGFFRPHPPPTTTPRLETHAPTHFTHSSPPFPHTHKHSPTHTPQKVHNPSGSKRVVVTKPLPGDRWLALLTRAGARVEVCTSPHTILSVPQIKALIGDRCDGVIGQLTEDWGTELFQSLKKAGGTAFSNYAVGYNNVDVPAATAAGIPVGNTPGVLTETTAELAAALTLAAARRVPEADVFMRAGHYKGWLPTLFVGSLLQGKTVGIVGAGRIGAAYARMMAEGHKMDVLYYDPYPNKALEAYIKEYGDLLEKHGERRITIERVSTVDDLLPRSDVLSLHCNLDADTRHLINAARLSAMKPTAVLVNAARGPVVDEKALVAHLKANPDFRCGLDVFEDEPAMAPGLADCPNAVIVPHIASASLWTRAGMATLAAANVAARLGGAPAWGSPDVLRFVDGPIDGVPHASPSIVNAADLGIPVVKDA